jgi:energy-coupling factor transporter ATP-binding protein EcfA2
MLKEVWGYYPAERLSVIGRLTKKNIQPKDGRAYSFYLLTDIRSVKDFTRLSYPIDPDSDNRIPDTVFVREDYIGQVMKGRGRGLLCVADVQLSSAAEREKRHNPFTLEVCADLSQLKEIPIDKSSIAQIGEDFYLEDLVVEHWKYKNRAEIEEAKRADLDSLESDYKEREEEVREKSLTLDQELEALESEKTQKRTELESLSIEVGQIEDRMTAANDLLGVKDDQLSALSREYQELKQKMESNLTKLTHFVREKGDKLLKLELISESDLAHLIGHQESDNDSSDYLSFEEHLGGNFPDAVKHIQAFLRKDNIYYTRDVLGNFLALLRTNDLIILAGDSGSGKTNLVHSVAKAIGGKAEIIPVKPNWTSSEDLLGYYNPLEKKYISTPFLDALIDASRHPDVPYLICLDEMNLARVEYYFADFLSKMEERNSLPELYLYSDAEASHTLSEFNTFLRLINEISEDLSRDEVGGYVEILRDEELNRAISKACGFQHGDSMLKYHSELRSVLSSFLNTPSSLRIPDNVRIIGTINVDETTHYLSPKILDRAHVVRFTNPLLFDWDQIEKEATELSDVEIPLKLTAAHLGERKPYPKFNHADEHAAVIIEIAREYLDPMGIEFGLRTVRQALNYFQELDHFGISGEEALNSFVLQKVLPKMMFEGDRSVGKVSKKDYLVGFRQYIEGKLPGLTESVGASSSLEELDRLIERAESNDWVVNYWTR